MKMNSLNIMIFGIVMNLLFAIVIADYQGNDYSDKIESGDDKAADVLDRLGSEASKTGDSQEELTWGSAISMFDSAWKIIGNAVNPSSLNSLAESTDTPMENAVKQGISVFRWLYAVIFALALYSFIKNRA